MYILSQLKIVFKKKKKTQQSISSLLIPDTTDGLWCRKASNHPGTERGADKDKHSWGQKPENHPIHPDSTGQFLQGETLLSWRYNFHSLQPGPESPDQNWFMPKQ